MSRASTRAAGPSAAHRPRISRRLLQLYPRAPFRLDLTAWALRRREQNRIDEWDARGYRRALLIGGRPVIVAATQTGTPSTPRLEVAVSGTALTTRIDSIVGEALERLLGLNVDLSSFYARADADPDLAPLVRRYRGLKPPRFPTLFECAMNAVACQQLSLEAGLTVLSRMAVGTAPGSEAPHPFPAPENVLRLSSAALRGFGFSERKASTILDLAQTAADGDLDLTRFEGLDDERAREALIRLPGIGRWSADYILLRGLGRVHVFPHGDVGALNGLRRFQAATGIDDDPGEALARWAPDAGLIYLHLLLRGLEKRGVIGTGMG